jgi:trk system potassium uptake protein TrkH
VIIMLMCVGGSPGGTAGGMKTITIVLIVLSIIATVRTRNETEAFQRQINDALVRRAAAVGLAFVALMAASTFLLLLSEPYPLMPVLFEAVSAATTTGLSLGITSELTAFGRGVIIVTMFLGRIGPLALLVAAMGATSRTRTYQYAHEDVMLG